ncbi:MAG: hypothetical protein AAF497_05565 [Planctomycetota bacterium]
MGKPEIKKPVRRWAIGQFLYVTAVVGVLLTVFQNVFLAVQDWNMVNWPWNVYAWLLFDIPVPGIKHGPPAGADLFLFLVNMVIAATVGFYAVVWTVKAIKKGWKQFAPASRKLRIES